VLIAAWVAAVITAAYLLVTYQLLRSQRDALELARQEAREHEEERRKDQARLLAAWSAGPIIIPPPGSMHSIRVHYRNGSDEPVYEAAVFVKSAWGPSPSVAPSPIGVLPPRTEGDVNLQLSLTLGDAPPWDPKSRPPVLITFRDAGGQWWKRDEHGALILSTDRPDVLAAMAPAP
jgi:hypothetical protein